VRKLDESKTGKCDKKLKHRRYHAVIQKCKHVAQSSYYAGCVATHAVLTTLRDLGLKTKRSKRPNSIPAIRKKRRAC
jgi:hypothetical protein